MKIFLICPVRNAGDEITKRIRAYVAAYEAKGHQVHWPAIDTKQDGDDIGIRICRDNRTAMFAADEVHVWYDPTSKGSCFDIGMAVYFERTHQYQVHIANPDDLEHAPASPQLSLLHTLTGHIYDHRPVDLDLPNWGNEFPIEEIFRHATIHAHTVTLNTQPSDTGALCMYGLIFAQMQSEPRKIELGIYIEQTHDKSFNNLLRWLASYTKDEPRIV